jgi:pimeloyl-ACP methyl ester carboxylesterase
VKNIADTEAYNIYDFVFSKTLRSLSHVISVKHLTRPFWSRWRASNIGDATIFRFLESLTSIDSWPSVGAGIVAEEIEAFDRVRDGLSAEQLVFELRRLSYLCNMAQWGSLPITDGKIANYRRCRDYYIEAESLAFGERYRRITLPWKNKTIFGNLHLPVRGGTAAPLVVIVHGIDGCKEEHLATELYLQESGLAVLGIDGPGQGEAFLLEGLLWSEDFYLAVRSFLDVLALEPAVDTGRVGLVGISIGGMWALRAAAGDPRVKALFDLGGPINTKAFPRLPFLIKTKMCQVTGARDPQSIAAVLNKNSVENDDILSALACAVRIVHGGRDRVVSLLDKEWLRSRLEALGNVPDVSVQVYPDGDHCCTGHAEEIRADMAAFFQEHLGALPEQSCDAGPLRHARVKH